MNKTYIIFWNSLNKIYFDYKFGISKFEKIIFDILKKNSKISWGQDLMLSSKDPFHNQYWLSYNQFKIDTEDWKKLIEWRFDYQKNDTQLIQKASARLFSSIKKGERIIITKESSFLRFVQYVGQHIIVKEDSGIDYTSETLKEDLEKFASVTTMYLCTWNKDILKNYVKSMHDSKFKIKKIYWKTVNNINDYIFLSTFLNIFPKSEINVLNDQNHNNNSCRIINRKDLKIGANSATLFLSNPFFKISKKFEIKFLSMEIHFDRLIAIMLGWLRIAFVNPEIVSIECAQLCSEDDKSINSIEEIMELIDWRNTFNILIEIDVNNLIYSEDCLSSESFKSISFNSLDLKKAYLDWSSLDNEGKEEIIKAIQIINHKLIYKPKKKSREIKELTSNQI